jgi:hypothetical protein
MCVCGKETRPSLRVTLHKLREFVTVEKANSHKSRNNEMKVKVLTTHERLSFERYNVRNVDYMRL